jgi:hypothetical protein
MLLNYVITGLKKDGKEQSYETYFRNDTRESSYELNGGGNTKIIHH